jgi:hypothetical protein
MLAGVIVHLSPLKDDQPLRVVRQQGKRAADGPAWQHVTSLICLKRARPAPDRRPGLRLRLAELLANGFDLLRFQQAFRLGPQAIQSAIRHVHVIAGVNAFRGLVAVSAGHIKGHALAPKVNVRGRTARCMGAPVSGQTGSAIVLLLAPVTRIRATLAHAALTTVTSRVVLRAPAHATLRHRGGFVARSSADVRQGKVGGDVPSPPNPPSLRKARHRGRQATPAPHFCCAATFPPWKTPTDKPRYYPSPLGCPRAAPPRPRGHPWASSSSR